MRYLLTTDPGLESVVVEELRERVAAGAADERPYGAGGHVRVECDDLAPLLALRTIHDVIELRHEGRARDTAEVAQAAEGFELPELDGAGSFRVTTVRRGEHPFHGVDVQRAAGGVLFRRYGTPVDLERFEVEVRVDLIGDHLVAGLRRTRASLGNRIRRARALRSALKPTVAAALLRLAGAHRGSGTLIDPMCGAGTIPIEAHAINPALEVGAADWDEPTVEVARETIRNHGLELPVERLDARALGHLRPAVYDFIVTDPPYGMRQARRASLRHLYATLLPSFERALRPAGTLALVVLKYRAFRAALETCPLVVADERPVDLGNVRPRLVILRRG